MKPPEESEVAKPEQSFLNLFWDLANSNDRKRLAAAEKLVSQLLDKQEECGLEKACNELEYALTRLIQGLGSGRKFARPGYAMALSYLLMKAPSSLITAQNVFTIMEDKLQLTEGLKSEQKELLLGQVFCVLTLIQSRSLYQDGNNVMIKKSVKTLLKLSKSKSYLRKMSYQGIIDIVKEVDSEYFDDVVWPLLLPLFSEGWARCYLELFELLNACCSHHPDTCGKNFLHSCGWIPKKADRSQLIGEHSYRDVARLFAESTVCHPQVSSFATDTLSLIGQRSSHQLGQFWSDYLTSTLFTSSPERQYLGLKLAIHSLSFIEPKDIPQVWSKELLTVLHQGLSHKNNPIHLICKQQLPKDLTSKLSEEIISPHVQYALLFQLFTSPGGIYLDRILHTTILASIVGSFNLETLHKYLKWLKNLFLNGTDEKSGIRELDLDVARRWSGSELLHLMKMPTLPRDEDWILSIVKFLFLHSRFSVNTSGSPCGIEEIDMIGKDFVQLADFSRRETDRNLTSAISALSSMAALPASGQGKHHDAEKDVVAHVPGVMSSGDFWLSSVINYADSLLSCERVSMAFEFDDSMRESWNGMMKNIARMAKIKSCKVERSSEARAMELLLINVGTLLLSMDVEAQQSALGVLGDLQVIINERFSKKKNERNMVKGPHWVEVLVEILLNMLSANSHTARVTSEQVFKLISPHLTQKALKLILDVLELKSSHELEKKNALNDGDVIEDDDDVSDDDASDVDDDDAEEDDEASDDASSDEDETSEVNEKFVSSVKEALGDAALSWSDEDADDIPDLTDEEMMQRDVIYSSLLRERKMAKAQGKEAKKQLMHFQIRCLDILEIFINRCRSNNTLVLDLVRPLLDVIERAAKDPDKQALAEKATVILRVKLCKMKNCPRNLTQDDLSRCYGNLKKLLSMATGGARGVFLSQMVSHASMFYIKVLSGCDGAYVDDVCQLYNNLVDEFMSKRQSKVQCCFLSDFVRCHPEIAYKLAPSLIKYITIAAQPYRKIQSCSLLISLFQSPASRDKMIDQSKTLINELKEIIIKSTDEPQSAKMKHMVKVVTLLDLPVMHMQRADIDYDWPQLVLCLKKFVETAEFKRSQAITNHTWTVLNRLGEIRVKTVKEKKQKKEKSKEESADAEPKESRRQMKARVMREKRMARKKGKVQNKPSKSSSVQTENKLNETDVSKKKKKRKTGKGEQV